MKNNDDWTQLESIRAGNCTGLYCGFVSYLGVAVWVEVRV